MYYMILAAMITTTNAAPLPMPMVIESYSTLQKCTDELVIVSRSMDFQLIKDPMFGRSIIRQYGKEGLTILFCAKDMRSV
jgi:hypothetical protein